MFNFIDFKKYKISWNTFDKVNVDQRVPFYTLNPVFRPGNRVINESIVNAVHRTGS